MCVWGELTSESKNTYTWLDNICNSNFNAKYNLHNADSAAFSLVVSTVPV